MATNLSALATALETDQEFSKSQEPVAQEVQDWVEAAFVAWQQDNAKWRSIVFPTMDDLDATLTDARHYTNDLRQPSLTIQTQKKPTAVDGGVRLVYRVRTKVHAGRKPAAK